MSFELAPFFANLFLHYYESRWIRQLRKSDIKDSRRFLNFFQFTDEHTAISDGEELERRSKDISPPELAFKIKSIHHYIIKGSFFFYFWNKIVHKKINFQLYDKRDDFSFTIVRMPQLTSNIPSKMFYSASETEIFQTACTISNCQNYKNLISRISKHSGYVLILQKSLLTLWLNNFDIFLGWTVQNNFCSFFYLSTNVGWESVGT